jgi:hypothetical protein
LYHPEDSDVRRLALSCSGHVTVPFARARYFVGLPSGASAFSNSCLTPRASEGARPEFPQGIPITLAPEKKSLRVFPALTEEGDDAVGELAEGHRVEGRGVEPVDDERAVAADPIEAFARRDAQGDRRGAVRCQILEILKWGAKWGAGNLLTCAPSGPAVGQRLTRDGKLAFLALGAPMTPALVCRSITAMILLAKARPMRHFQPRNYTFTA